MPRTALKKCSCPDQHAVSGQRGDGTPIALWTCPVHGKVFEEVPSGIVLTDIQRDVLQAISDEHKAGRPAGVDEISRLLNYSTWTTQRAFEILQSLNFVERS